MCIVEKIMEKPIEPIKEIKPSQKIRITKEILEELYINQGLSVRECAKKLGLPSHGAISWRLKKFGIKARPGRFQKGNTFNKNTTGMIKYFMIFILHSLKDE